MVTWLEKNSREIKKKAISHIRSKASETLGYPNNALADISILAGNHLQKKWLMNEMDRLKNAKQGIALKV